MKTDKSLGQHWLIDDQVVQNIIETINPVTTDTVLEIGPGTGALLDRLVQEGLFVNAVELDSRLFGLLKKRYPASSSKVELFHMSFLDFDLAVLGRHGFVVGNIPYNVTKPILQHIAKNVESVERSVLLMQKEVAERICGSKGSILQMSIAWLYEAKGGIVVPPEAFDPPPRVQSQLLILNRRQDPLVSEVNFGRYLRWVKIGFASKRKKLVKNLAADPTHSKEFYGSAVMDVAGSPDVRAEELSPLQWAQLAEKLEKG